MADRPPIGIGFGSALQRRQAFMCRFQHSLGSVILWRWPSASRLFVVSHVRSALPIWIMADLLQESARQAMQQAEGENVTLAITILRVTLVISLAKPAIYG